MCKQGNLQCLGRSPQLLLCQLRNRHSPHSSQGSANTTTMQDIPLPAFIPTSISSKLSHAAAAVGYLSFN